VPAGGAHGRAAGDRVQDDVKRGALELLGQHPAVRLFNELQQRVPIIPSGGGREVPSSASGGRRRRGGRPDRQSRAPRPGGAGAAAGARRIPCEGPRNFAVVQDDKARARRAPEGGGGGRGAWDTRNLGEVEWGGMG